MTGAEALARYREAQTRKREKEAERLALKATGEDRRKLDYIRRQLTLPRDPKDHALLLETRGMILRRLEA